MAIGRPSIYTEELADEICRRLANGESLRKICTGGEFDGIPGEATVYRWLNDNLRFREKYARAREIQADGEFEEAREIAMSATPENVQVARLQVDTIKWRAGKLAPKKYGDKLALTGGDATDAPVKSEVTVKFVRPS